MKTIKRVMLGVVGAVLGYATVALTIGWFVTNDLAMVVFYLVGMVVGVWVAAFRTSQNEEGA